MANIWKKIIKDSPRIEELEIAGLNRHRSECFRTAFKLVGGREPADLEDLVDFVDEYVRQLIGPELWDVYYASGDLFDEAAELDARKTFRVFRKYTLGV